MAILWNVMFEEKKEIKKKSYICETVFLRAGSVYIVLLYTVLWRIEYCEWIAMMRTSFVSYQGIVLGIDLSG